MNDSIGLVKKISISRIFSDSSWSYDDEDRFLFKIITDGKTCEFEFYEKEIKYLVHKLIDFYADLGNFYDIDFNPIQGER